MLKLAMTVLVLGFFSCSAANAQATVDAGFGGPPLPAEPTNTQIEQVNMPGNEALAQPGQTAPTGSQGAGGRNLPSLPPVTTGLISRPGMAIKDLPGARYATLSDKPFGADAASAAKQALQSSAVAEPLPPARYAILSDDAPLIPAKRASEGF